MFIYFIKSENAIKIGKTKSLASRWNAIQNGNHTKLKLLKCLETDYGNAEKFFHKRFEGFRLNGEWFSLSVEPLIDEAIESATFETKDFKFMKNIKSWGGKRKGAGRPAKEPTKTLSYRVPEKVAEILHLEIKKLIIKTKEK